MQTTMSSALLKAGLVTNERIKKVNDEIEKEKNKKVDEEAELSLLMEKLLFNIENGLRDGRKLYFMKCMMSEISPFCCSEISKKTLLEYAKKTLPVVAKQFTDKTRAGDIFAARFLYETTKKAASFHRTKTDKTDMQNIIFIYEVLMDFITKRIENSRKIN